MLSTRSSRGLRRAGLALVAGSMLLPSASGLAADAPTVILASLPAVSSSALTTTAAPATTSGERPTERPEPAPAPRPATAEMTAEMTAELECMAKVVHHEAGGEPRRGQLAVAQLMLNRKQSGRFADSICGVAAQRGQFFDTNAYNPPRDTARWQSAIEVSREAMTGASEPVMPGAVFFRAAYSRPTAFFRTRPQIAQLGGHVFYR